MIELENSNLHRSLIINRNIIHKRITKNCRNQDLRIWRSTWEVRFLASQVSPFSGIFLTASYGEWIFSCLSWWIERLSRVERGLFSTRFRHYLPTWLPIYYRRPCVRLHPQLSLIYIFEGSPHISQLSQPPLNQSRFQVLKSQFHFHFFTQWTAFAAFHFNHI